MKTLFISLMRIGDLVMHAEVAHAQIQQTQSEVCFLINREAVGLIPLLPWVKQFFVFDRELVFQSMKSQNSNLESGYNHIEQIVNEIEEECFDEVVNLTHTNVGARFMDLIKAPLKQGLEFKDGQIAPFKNLWMKEINDLPIKEGKVAFHQIDLLKGLLRIEGRGYPLIESEKGREEAFEFLEGNRFIAFQLFTSDAKKNWEIERYFNLFLYLRDSLPEMTCLVIATPSEYQMIQDKIGESLPSNVKIAVTSIEGAYSILKMADLLVSGDTLVKHLAAAANCPTLELVIGSSRFRETAAYSSIGYQMVTQELCYPCRHTESCHRERKFCSDRITSSDVSQVIEQLVKNNPTELVMFCKKQTRNFKLYKGSFDLTERWQADNYLICAREALDGALDRYRIVNDHRIVESFYEKYFRVVDLRFVHSELNDARAQLVESLQAQRLSSQIQMLNIKIQFLNQLLLLGGIDEKRFGTAP